MVLSTTYQQEKSKWIVVETYYKHGDYSLSTITSEDELRKFILENLLEYGYEYTEENEDIYDLIEKIETLGNQRIKDQSGWGVREIKEIRESELETKWAVVETYYKYGEYSLVIITSKDELRKFILENLLEYEYTEEEENEDISDLIEKIETLGNQRVENQSGWGVREIKEI